MGQETEEKFDKIMARIVIWENKMAKNLKAKLLYNKNLWCQFVVIQAILYEY